MPEVRIPNLFLVGAPKCGTTALSRYLADHPDIYMSEQAGNKEPEHFSADLWPKKTKITDRGEYLALFAPAPGPIAYLGEASVNYLYSQVAVGNILDVSGDAKFIAMVRNPLDLAQSLHNERVKHSDEPATEFERAWNIQWRRMRGGSLPPWQPDYRVFQYGERAMLGGQLRRLFQSAPAEQIHVIVYDDFMADPASAYRGVLDFLGLERDGRTEFPVVNASVGYRIPALQRGLVRARNLRMRLGLPGGWGIHDLISRRNAKPATPPPLRSEFRRELKQHFREDVQLLSGILGRDLRYWLE